MTILTSVTKFYHKKFIYNGNHLNTNLYNLVNEVSWAEILIEINENEGKIVIFSF